MSSSEDDDTYMNEGEIEGEKPEITIEQKNELLKKVDDSIKSHYPILIKEMDFFVKF